MTQDQRNHSDLPEVGGLGLAFGTPRKLPKAARLPGRVAVLDIAFASESGGRRNAFEKTTLKFIDQLAERLVAWVDHHDSAHHARFADDPRFTLASKAEHGACPEMVTPAVVAAAGQVDSLVCHTDFDGIASAAKWILGGREPYPGCDDDARAVDTRIGLPGEVGRRCDRALRARPRDQAVMLAVARFLCSELEDAEASAAVDEAGADLAPREAEANRLAQGYRALTDELSVVEVAGEPYDKTWLLLLGQQRTTMAVVIDRDTVTFAAPFDSGVSFLERFELSGGMPTLVSIHRARLAECLMRLGVDEATAQQLEKG
jgi:hypothetical protein